MRSSLNHPPSTITALAERTGYVQSRVSTAVAGMVARVGQDAVRPRRWPPDAGVGPDDVRSEAQEFKAAAKQT